MRSILVLVVAAMLLELTTAVQYFATRRDITWQLKEMAQRDLNETNHTAKIKQEVEKTVLEHVDDVERMVANNEIDSLKYMLRHILTHHAHITGMNIAFIPGYMKGVIPNLPSHGRYGIYIYGDEGNWKEQSIDFDYTQRTWFHRALDNDVFWSEPYEGKYNVMLMCTFSRPVHDKNGKTVGVLAADVPLHELSAMATQLYDNQRHSLLPVVILQLLGLIVLAFIIQRYVASQRRLMTVANEMTRIENELNIARNIQMAMLPKVFPPFPERDDVDVYASLTPAREVGGDFYDFLIRNEQLFFCIGDVSGKGVPAALLMMATRQLFRTEAKRINKESTVTAADIVQMMNRSICEGQSSGYFATMFVGILDLNTGVLDYCNAGHEAPILGGVPMKVYPNLPVGALPDWKFQGQTTAMTSDITLFLFTDGLSELRDIDGHLFSRKKVVNLAKENNGNHASDLVAHMAEEVHSFAGKAEQSDDITMMAIEWKGLDSLSFAPVDLQDDLPQLKEFVSERAKKAGMSTREMKRLRLVVEEALANAAMHGKAQEVTMAAKVTDKQFTICVIDDGAPFDPTTAPTTDLSMEAENRPVGGLGLVFMRQMSDLLEYRRLDDKNMLVIKNNIHHDNNHL